MQDIHSIGDGGGGGGRRGVDIMLRSEHQQNNQTVKCPRCGSVNTKFCYYNNYNLSQPRHFCKSCRRYWTKGGVLRNVPVGGGCRKAKRPRTKHSSESPTVATAAASAPSQQQHGDQRDSNSHSSSESSCLIAANSNVAVTNNNISYTGGTAEAVSAVTSYPNKVNVSKSELYGNPNNSIYEAGILEQGSEPGIFPEIGSFTSSNNETLPFEFSTSFNGQGQWPHQKIEEITGGLVDQTVPVELSNLHGGAEIGFGALDWEGSGDQRLFDLPSDIDQTYWSQSQWTADQDDPTLDLP